MIYNDEKFYSWLAYKTPAEIYCGRRELKKFQIGEKDKFHKEQGETVAGIIIRVNKKSLTVRIDTGDKWYVHPCL